jgi:membrane protein DedA with SNARE-associated domain
MSLLQSFIHEYGYLTVFLGAMVEGESIILTASALAARQILSIWWVMGLTFVGTVLADQVIYFLGLKYGPSAVQRIRDKFPSWQKHIDKGLDFIKRNETVYILSFRFIYGIRIISPFLIGAQGIPFRRFSFLNIISALIWTLTSCAAGYFLGTILGDMAEHIEWFVAGIFVFVFLVSHLISRRKSRDS